MDINNSYKCVNCGKAANALFKTYGPLVLKLTKCESCKGVVDKYIEYDTVIVMIDLILMSREAQRHIIYNTEFKPYWKLFIVLTMLETYGVWKNDSLFNIAINTLCNIKNNSTINSTHITLPINITLNGPWLTACKGWEQKERESNDLFLWEKDFYIQFLSTFTGIMLFISTFHLMMSLCNINGHKNVAIIKLIKSFTLANMSILFTLPMIVWGNTDTPPETRLLHYLMVFLYSFVLFYNVFRVLYVGPKFITVVVLFGSYFVKYLNSFFVAPIIRMFMMLW